MAGKAMTKEEFKRRWEKDDRGDGITFDDVAECAIAWGLFQTPRVHNISRVTNAVVKAAGIDEEYGEEEASL